MHRWHILVLGRFRRDLRSSLPGRVQDRRLHDRDGRRFSNPELQQHLQVVVPFPPPWEGDNRTVIHPIGAVGGGGRGRVPVDEDHAGHGHGYDHDLMWLSRDYGEAAGPGGGVWRKIPGAPGRYITRSS